jgi:hypothetical protein
MQNTMDNLKKYTAVPEAARKFLAYQGTDINFGTRGVTGLDHLKRLSGGQPSGYRKGDSFDKVAAMVSWQPADKTNKRNPYGHSVMAVGGGSSTYGSGSVNVSAHEAAHAIDTGMFFNANGTVSIRPKFTELRNLTLESFNVNPYYVQKDNMLNQGAREFFAETYAGWAEGKAQGLSGDRLATLIMSAVDASPIRYTGKGTQSDAREKQLEIGREFVAFYEEFQKEVEQTAARQAKNG